MRRWLEFVVPSTSKALTLATVGFVLFYLFVSYCLLARPF
jgi:hypothetical protein